jgi:hypothetical protein
MTIEISVSSGPPGFRVSTGRVSAGQTMPYSARFSVPTRIPTGSLADHGGAAPGNRRCHPFDCDTVFRGAAPPASG